MDDNPYERPVEPEKLKEPERRDFMKYAIVAGISAVTGVGTARLLHENHEHPSPQIRHVDRTLTLDEKIERVIEKVKHSTVQIEGMVEHPFMGPMPITGSGVIFVDRLGRRFILTCHHVLEQSDMRDNESETPYYNVVFYNGSDKEEPQTIACAPVMLKDGTRAWSEEYDFGLLRLPPDAPLFPAVKFRDFEDDKLRLGENIVLVGAPFGLRDTVTSGIVSHTEREWDREPQNTFMFTDAQANPGNSGCGAFDLQGRLCGLLSWGIGGSGLGGVIRGDIIKQELEKMGIPVQSLDEKNATKVEEGDEETPEEVQEEAFPHPHHRPRFPGNHF